jgi:PAS domain S-box-containing protein
MFQQFLRGVGSRIGVFATMAILIILTLQMFAAHDHKAFILLGITVVITLREVGSTKRQQERLDMIMNAATEIAVVATDLDGTITMFNSGAERMLGYDADEIIGSDLSKRIHDPIELKQRAEQYGVGTDEVLAQIANSAQPTTEDWIYINKDGRQLTVSLAMTALRKRAGKVIGYLGIAAEVTQRREQEREREHLLWLEQQLSLKLLTQNDELQRMDRTKDEFVSTVSHEFRTPLTSIRGYLETLADGDAGELNETQHRFVDIVQRNTDRLFRLVEDLLFAARVDSGGTSVAIFTEVDIASLLGEVMDSARPHAQDKNISLSCETEEGIFVAADPARLLQLFDNLVNNALKFTPEFGEVRIATHISGENVIVSVSDNGIGIPTDEQSKLFQRFFRSRLATEHVIGGTGIGLAVVKEIADAHGAELRVESQEGPGTTFRLVMHALQALDIQTAGHR